MNKDHKDIHPMVSVIIPVLKINNFLKESIPIILNLDYDNYEIIVLPNELSNEDNRIVQKWGPKVRVITTEKINRPAEKRDIGAKIARGEILAFLDDDAYPKRDWISKAIKHFTNHNIAAVGGPAVTPRNDPIFAKASGAIYTSSISSGNLTFRYWPTKYLKEVEDYPSVNLFVRKSIFNLVGGFDSQYWPGEDTKLCLEIKKIKKQIIYDPEVFVWHHRRSSPINHLKQVWHYSQHRGFFVKKYPETSKKIIYFLPSIFVSVIIFGFIMSLYSQKIKILYNLFFLFYLTIIIIASVIESIRWKNFFVGLLSLPLFFLTHIIYGIGFFTGIIKRELEI